MLLCVDEIQKSILLSFFIHFFVVEIWKSFEKNFGVLSSNEKRRTTEVEWQRKIHEFPLEQLFKSKK